MGQGASSSSLLSRKSVSSSASKSSLGGFQNHLRKKLIKTSALTEELIFTPRTSAHTAFKKYSYKSQKEDEDGKDETFRRKRRKSAKGEGDRRESSVSSDTPILLNDIKIEDVFNIKASWTNGIENHLAKVGVRIFLLLFESQPAIKRRFRAARSKRHSELQINEDLHKHVLYLMGGIKKILKYLHSDHKALNRYLKRLAKKHLAHRCANVERSDNINGMDLVFILNAEDFGTVFVTAIKQTMTTQTMNPETESSWMSFFRCLMKVLQGLTRGEDENEFRRKKRSSDGAGSLGRLSPINGYKEEEVLREEELFLGSSDEDSVKPTASFDRHLVLVGCQTFQEFFDRHPEVLEHFEKFNLMEIDQIKVSEALRMHASRVLAIVEDIVENTGNPDKIRSILKDLGQHHWSRGITLEHLEMLGPLLCHTIRPFVFSSGLWTIEVEKSWTHLFEMVATLMKRGYPPSEERSRFPTLTHTLILKDTWSVIVDQMHSLGLSTFIKLFRLNANLKYYYRRSDRPTHSFPTEDVNRHFERQITVLDGIIRNLPDFSPHVPTLQKLGETHSDVDPRLLALMGPVFCNTVRPLLLVQGRWSYQVEMAWLLLFRHISAFMYEGYGKSDERKSSPEE